MHRGKIKFDQWQREIYDIVNYFLFLTLIYPALEEAADTNAPVIKIAGYGITYHPAEVMKL